jgi:hypothetical protein
MKDVAPSMLEHLLSGTTTLAWCWRIERADGEVLGFTDHDRSLTFNDTPFESESGLVTSEAKPICKIKT